MVRNVRWLYSKLGTEDFSAIGGGSVTGALSSLQSELDGKSPSSHNHGTSSLPVSSNQVNSVNYIPTSAMLYSMAQRVEGIQTLIATAKRELDDPNKRYEDKSLGTWSSISQVDSFLTRFNHENNYSDGDTKLSLGNSIIINEGTYNAEWVIAGFDLENCRVASDGTIYDNGYGICLIPQNYVHGNISWNATSSTSGGYLNAGIRSSLKTLIVDEIEKVLGSHIVTRNVLLSNGIDSSNGYSNGYTWTTDKATLMSIGQLTGTFASHHNRYDDGEANYYLPLLEFGHNKYSSSDSFWVRNIESYNGVYLGSKYNNGFSWGSNKPNSSYKNGKPLIYIR